jgi:hypothetical protein
MNRPSIRKSSSLSRKHQEICRKSPGISKSSNLSEKDWIIRIKFNLETFQKLQFSKQVFDGSATTNQFQISLGAQID